MTDTPEQKIDNLNSELNEFIDNTFKSINKKASLYCSRAFAATIAGAAALMMFHPLPDQQGLIQTAKEKQTGPQIAEISPAHPGKMVVVDYKKVAVDVANQDKSDLETEMLLIAFLAGTAISVTASAARNLYQDARQNKPAAPKPV